MRWALLLAVALTGCGRGVPAFPEDRPDAAAPLAAAETCSTKILFQQANGCVNDGAFELCAPADDPGATAALGQVSPTLFRLGTAGRLKCMAPETTWLRPLVDPDCVTPRGAMIDATWREVCSLAALNDVRVIGPFFTE